MLLCYSQTTKMSFYHPCTQQVYKNNNNSLAECWFPKMEFPEVYSVNSKVQQQLFFHMYPMKLKFQKIPLIWPLYERRLHQDVYILLFQQSHKSDADSISKQASEWQFNVVTWKAKQERQKNSACAPPKKTLPVKMRGITMHKVILRRC